MQSNLSLFIDSECRYNCYNVIFESLQSIHSVNSILYTKTYLETIQEMPTCNLIEMLILYNCILSYSLLYQLIYFRA